MLADLDVNDGPGAVGAVPPGERIVQGRRRDGEKQFMRTHAMYQSLSGTAAVAMSQLAAVSANVNVDKLVGDVQVDRPRSTVARCGCYEPRLCVEYPVGGLRAD